MIAYNKNPLYFKNFIDERYIEKQVPIVFDEIHKHREWRNILKGLFDTSGDKIKILVTGSARFNFFRMAGDSLLGRYFSFQMLPLGLPELTGNFSHIQNNESVFMKGETLASHARNAGVKESDEGLEHLFKFGGFPEPVIKGSERFHRRWQRDNKTLLTKEDVRDLFDIIYQGVKDLES